MEALPTKERTCCFIDQPLHRPHLRRPLPLIRNLPPSIQHMPQGVGLLPFIGTGALSYVMHASYLNPKWERL